MDVLSPIAAILVGASSLVAGGWLGFSVARRVPLSLELASANPAAVRITMVLMRVFIFLILMSGVSMPIVFLAAAIFD
ncbi:MAG: hypothetical protein WD939_00905 [Dehalococcoidia bacterium]